MVYRLANKFGSYRNAIAVVGCGGTGGFAAEGICRLLAGRTVPKQLVLIDGDRVEERNLGRQNFYPEDLGISKPRPWPSAWPGGTGSRWPTPSRLLSQRSGSMSGAR